MRNHILSEYNLERRSCPDPAINCPQSHLCERHGPVSCASQISSVLSNFNGATRMILCQLIRDTASLQKAKTGRRRCWKVRLVGAPPLKVGVWVGSAGQSGFARASVASCFPQPTLGQWLFFSQG